jgi:hypothetical protein
MINLVSISFGFFDVLNDLLENSLKLQKQKCREILGLGNATFQISSTISLIDH